MLLYINNFCFLGNEQPHLDTPPFESQKSHDSVHEYITPTGSPEPDNAESSGNNSLSLDEDMRKPAFPEENGDSYKDLPPVSKHMPPIPYLGTYIFFI